MTQELSRRDFAKKGAVALLSTGAAGTLLAACGGSDSGTAVSGTASAPAGNPVRGGTLTVGIGQLIQDINPYTANFYRWTQLIAPTMYEPLVKFGNGGKVIPLLAESWSHSADFKTWKFVIRRGVKFHTGADLTSADVVYSLNQINDAKSPISVSFPLASDTWGGATAADPYTVTVKLKRPVNLVEQMRWWWILPEGARKLGARFQTESLGTGPFKLRKFAQGSRIDVVRHADYWNPGRPYLDGLGFVFLPDTATQIANFTSGGVDMLHDVGVLDLDTVKGRNNSKVVAGGLFFHWWMPQMLFGPLQSTEARVALRHAFNRAKLNQVAWVGKGTDSWNPLDQTPYGINETPDADYDINRARKELKAAGVAGQQLDLHVLKGIATSELEAQILVEDFNAAGLKSKVVQLDPTAWVNGLFVERNGTGIFNNAGTLPFPWANITRYLMEPPIDPLPPKYAKSPAPELLSSQQATAAAYTSEQLDRSIRATQRMMLAQSPVFHTFTAELSEIVPQNLEGLESTTFGDIRFDGAYLA